MLVINGAICNGSDLAGCGQVPPKISAGFNAIGVAVDTRTHVVYTTNLYDSSVSVIDGVICNRFISFGCALVPPKLPSGTSRPQSSSTRLSGLHMWAADSGISVLPLAP